LRSRDLPPRKGGSVQVVFFDVGETILDETREWAGWADWIGVSHFTLMAVLGAVIERGEHHTRVFDILSPGFDLAGERAARSEAGRPSTFLPEDLYPDAIACMNSLRESGRLVGIAGNQPAQFERQLAAAGVPADIILSSESLRAEKPRPEFFQGIVERGGYTARQTAYVGDRLDNDVLPARAAGLVSIFLKRGPWAHIQWGHPRSEEADFHLSSLTELPESLI
jgi:FMN phosphatase YigB (HAD superfamily)